MTASQLNREYEPWKKLAAAIVKRAIKDYTKALRKMYMYPGPEHRQLRIPVIRYEKIFKTEHFGILTDIEPDFIIRTIRERVSNECDARRKAFE